MFKFYCCVLFGQFFHIFKRNKLSLLLLLTILLILRYRNILLFNYSNSPTKSSTDDEKKSKFGDENLNPVIVTPCKYPDFVIREKFQFLDPKDPTSRARLGPNPQVQKAVNYTVIYNFASPKPLLRRIEKKETGVLNNVLGDKEEEEDVYDEVEEGKNNDYEEIVDEDRLTLATHGTPDFIPKHLPNLLRNWPNHPISLAIYAPVEDFCAATALISWFWNCQGEVSKFVSFHVFFPASLANDVASKTASEGIQILDVDCDRKPFVRLPTFRQKSNNLPYPINTARNIARSGARTKYILNTDITLIPSPKLADNFIRFVQKVDKKNEAKSKLFEVVYVVPIFELDSNVAAVPQNKGALVDLYREDKLVYFHKFVCKNCHLFPRLHDWLKTTKKISSRAFDPRIRIFHSARLSSPFKRWTPIFIGTHTDPLFDERFTWEGFRDKSALFQEMCILKYKFAILDTPFLIRQAKSGILKVERDSRYREIYMRKTELNLKKIGKELKNKYGSSESCNIL